MRNLVSFLLFATVATTALLGCDAKPTEVTKEVHDTSIVYKDRFAQSLAVVYGAWTVTTATDTADAYFFQDSNQVTAYIPWKHASTWNLTSVSFTKDSINLSNGGATPLYVYGKFTKVTPAANKTQSDMINEIKGSYFDAAHPSGTLPTWTAVRKN